MSCIQYIKTHKRTDCGKGYEEITRLIAYGYRDRVVRTRISNFDLRSKWEDYGGRVKGFLSINKKHKISEERVPLTCCRNGMMASKARARRRVARDDIRKADTVMSGIVFPKMISKS